MKKSLLNIVITLVLSIVALTAYSQEHYLGIRGGVVGGKVRFKPNVESKYHFGTPTVGLAYKYYGVAKYVGAIEVDLNYVARGFKILDGPKSDTAYIRTLNSIEIPFMWQPHVNMFKNRARFFLNAGPYIAYTFKSKERYESKQNGVIWERDYKLDNLVDNKFDYGLSLGAGFGGTIKNRIHITAEFRYIFAFSDIIKGKAKRPGSKYTESPLDQMTVTLGVYYKFNKAKKE